MSDNLATVANGKNVEPIRNGRTVAPRVDIFETDRELLMYADLPGVALSDVDLRYEDGELVLQGKVAAERQGNLLAREFEPVDFYRVFRVHETIDAGKIEAEFKNGVLTVHLPKEEKHQPRKVAIKA
jgi:HSP20 family molecular chaperone IbpA